MTSLALRLAVPAVLAAGLLVAPVSTAPAAADTRWCSVQPKLPRAALLRGATVVDGPASARCIGWGSSSTYEVQAIVEQRLGTGGVYRWVRGPMIYKRTGAREALYRTSYVPGMRYRTRARMVVRAASGRVVMQGRWVQSPAVTLR